MTYVCVSKNHKQTVIIIIIIIHDISGAIKVFLPFNMTPFIKIYPREIKQKCINYYVHKNVHAALFKIVKN